MKSKWIRAIVLLSLLLMVTLANLAATTTSIEAGSSSTTMVLSSLETSVFGNDCCAEGPFSTHLLGAQGLPQSARSRKVELRNIGKQIDRTLAQSIKVECFFEDDPAWKCDQLGFNPLTTIGTCQGKYRRGCTLTSLAMIVRYFGVDTDPGRLNQWLKSNDGFLSGTNKMKPCAVTKLEGVDSCQHFKNKDVATLKSELDTGHPVLLGLWNGKETYHWVVATGYSGNTIFYNDPAFDPCDGRTLDASADTFNQMYTYHGDSPPPPTDTTPPSIEFTSIPATDRWYSTNQILSWIISDPESGVDYFKWEWDDSSPDKNRVDNDHGSAKLSAAGQGKHTLYVRAWNNDGKASSVVSRGWFGYDTAKPNEPSINRNCNALNNQWQNTCRDPNFTWSATDPNGSKGSGVVDYAYAWVTNPSATPSNWSGTTSYDPGPIADSDSWAKYYLHVRARDVAGNPSPVSTFGLWYDGSIPTVTLSINGGAATTNQTTVRLDLSASDTGSGLADMRISNNGLTWSNWQPYADTIPWTLPALDRRTLTVYVQVRDEAGNESAVASDSIALDLYPAMPHSANYRICDDVVDAGGSVGVASTSYSLVSAIGQPWATGATDNTSTGFAERAGFLASITGCLPITRDVTSNYTLTNWVVASGGNLRGSASYRLGDTAGQPAASGNNTFVSASYLLSSGFWAQISGTVPPAPVPPPPAPTLTPTIPPPPTPTPTPQPSSFGVRINDGELYTKDSFVTVQVWAPNVTHVRLSNDSNYSNEDWRTYQITTTWVLSTYADYVTPRYVYVWFRDAQNSVYGSYFDDIIYDPVAPEGQVVVLGSEVATVTLWLEAWDDNSGIADMRVSETLTMTLASWQPFTETMEWVLTSDMVYAQFRDNAGNISPIYGSDGKVHIPNAKHVYLPLVVRGYTGPICPTPLTGVDIGGPTVGYTDTAYAFTALPSPAQASQPITYTWTPTPLMQAGDVATYTWTLTGTQYITLTAANCGGDAVATHVISIQAASPPTCPVPLAGVDIIGPAVGYTDTAYAFTAIPNPAQASQPITYTWTPTPLMQAGDVATYTWAITGTHHITVTAANCGGTIMATHTISITQGTGLFGDLENSLKAGLHFAALWRCCTMSRHTPGVIQ